MTDQEKREKVINGLECCDNDDCDRCSYFRSDDENDLETCKATLHRDTLVLLKAQEAMLVVSKDTNEIIGDCPRCGRHVIHWHNKYCAECGQAVKWE